MLLCWLGHDARFPDVSPVGGGGNIKKNHKRIGTGIGAREQG